MLTVHVLESSEGFAYNIRQTSTVPFKLNDVKFTNQLNVFFVLSFHH